MLTLSQYMLRLEVKDETLKQLLEEWKKNRVEMYEEKNNLIWLENHFLHDLEYKALIVNNIFIWRLFDGYLMDKEAVLFDWKITFCMI